MKIKHLLITLLFLFSQAGFSVDIKNLFSAAIHGKTERVKSLLAEGIEVNGKTATGRTAMMAASFNGNLRVARILLSYGADVNLADNQGTTALMDAVIFGREELVRLLITAGADVLAVDNQDISVIEKAKKTKFSHIVAILEKAVVPKEEAENDSTKETEETTESTVDENKNKEEE